MFVNACNQIRECLYGVSGVSVLGPSQINVTTATGFMVAPGILMTAAHSCHVQNDPSQPLHSRFEVIRSPDIGQSLEQATLIAADSIRDIALLRIASPRSLSQVVLHARRVPTGEICGSLGFPLATVSFSPSGYTYHLVERFQGASISAYQTNTHPSGRALDIYETDSLMYPGSSGCPGFLTTAQVFGIHTASLIDQPQHGAPQGQGGGTRLAVSVWVPSADIVSFMALNGIQVSNAVT